MIIDVYEYFKQHPGSNKLVGSDYLFVEYKCPINVEEYQLWTESHLITYVINGKKDWISTDKTYEIRKGDALFVRKGVYSTRQYLEVDYCVILFFINDAFIRNFIAENQLDTPDDTQGEHDPIFEIDVSDSLEFLIHSVFNYLKEGGDIPKSLVEIKFKELMFNIILNSKNRKLVQYFGSLNHGSKTDLEYTLLKNFRHDLSMEDFAKLCGRSLSTFKRDVKAFFNETPGNFLKNKRLEFAKSLLKSSELSVNEVCYESGFKNPSHFNKIFKAKYQLPPKQYRLLHGNS
jgi:AraC family transcriptional regulator, exoenzyme S synthesis regulatory protein ExsA